MFTKSHWKSLKSSKGDSSTQLLFPQVTPGHNTFGLKTLAFKGIGFDAKQVLLPKGFWGHAYLTNVQRTALVIPRGLHKMAIAMK